MPLPEVKEVDPRVNPPIVPLVAVTAPAGVTLNSALPKVSLPK